MESVYYSSPFGSLELRILNDKLIRTFFCNHLSSPTHTVSPSNTAKEIISWLDCYFKGYSKAVPKELLDPQGTEFQKLVWKCLCDLPFGHSTSYGALAISVSQAMGKAAMSAQAIGQALSANPILLLIPCHRVLKQDRRMGGYSAGIEIKKKLLDHENIAYR